METIRFKVMCTYGRPTDGNICCRKPDTILPMVNAYLDWAKITIESSGRYRMLDLQRREVNTKNKLDIRNSKLCLLESEKFA